jgi:integrase
MATLYRRSNGIYYSISYFHGRQIWRSTGARSKKQAQKVLAGKARSRKTAPSEITLSGFTSQFLHYAQTNCSPGTVLLYEQAARTFGRIIGDFHLKAYTVQDVEEFKSRRLKEVSPVKVNIDFRTLKALFQVAIRWSLLETNPFRLSKQIRVPPQRPTYISKEAFRKLLGAIDLPWFRELVIFAVCTMMRSGEILSLRWESIDLARRLILIENTKDFRVKTSKPRVVPMNEWVFRFLATRERKEGYLFSLSNGKKFRVGYISHRFKRFVRSAGLPDEIHFHSLRHTGATWLVQDGVSIYAIQKLLGHSNISITQVYSHLETDSLFRSIERLTVPTLAPELKG